MKQVERIYGTVSAAARARTALLAFAAVLLCFGGICRGGTLPESGELADFRQIIADAKRRVFPSVVFLMPITERFDAGRKEKTQVAGSGVIISSRGEVVTNWHVVDKAVEIRCLLYDGQAYSAAVVGVDKDTDLALLRLDAPDGTVFPAATLADSSSLEEGQFVMAMGAPWGLSRSVSMGILSCVNRFLPDQGGGYNLWLQTDASINPGNSGGPLIDTGGQVVGVNSLGFLLGGDLAFAIPANTVRHVVEKLRRDGKVRRAWTGIHLQPLKDFNRNIFYNGDRGVLVASVDPGSPADLAGIQVGDLLLAVAGQPVVGINHEDIPGINQSLAELPIGQPSAITLGDGSAERVAMLTPVEKGGVAGSSFDCRRWNMTVKSINEFANPMLHFFRSEGVYIQAVKYPGNAEAGGLAAGDIIIEIDGVPIPDLAACQAVYETIIADPLREKKAVFTVMRAGLKNYHIIDYAPIYGQE
ncbi:MAG: trypsin-like peptidase domain-containing protein [Planctomycetes bacterium]|nr:trypsin-like peptidase domain-containing protein [Planctomycetota bacterium]